MTSLNPQLWELIETHPMPANRSGVPFIDRLMHENRITRETAETAIEEYRKFMYLCATREDRNVPSKAVDLVWHLHMQYSRDYWDVFCAKIGKPIHHDPGGEDRAHLDDYKATLAAYRQLFGTPPNGIWRQENRGAHVLGLLFSGAMIAAMVREAGFGVFAGLLPLLFVAIPFLLFLSSLRALTDRGAVALVFDASDPFADQDAGDCGSGDGGGCGD